MNVPVEVHGIVPTSENLADGMATKPGDIHTAMDGTTVEILNTDAEGRLILGDALTVPMIIGGAMVVVGVGIVTIRQAAKGSAPDAEVR